MLLDKTFSAISAGDDIGVLTDGQVYTYQTIWGVTGGGTVTGETVAEATNDMLGQAGWKPLLTSSESAVSDGHVTTPAHLQHGWARVRVRCTALSGSGGTPSVRSIISSR